MTPYRFLTVLLMLTVQQCRVDGFTIHRTAESTPELVPAGSNLHVRNDLKSHAKFTTLKGEGLTQTTPIQTTAKNVTTEWTTTITAPTMTKAATNTSKETTVMSTAATTVTSTAAAVITTSTSPPNTTIQVTTIKRPETTESSTSERSTESITETSLSSSTESTSETIIEDKITTTSENLISSTIGQTTNNVFLVNMNNTSVKNKTNSTMAIDNNNNITVPPKEMSMELTTEVNNVTSYSTEPVKANGTTIADTSSIKKFDGSGPSEITITTIQIQPTTQTKANNEISETTTNVIKATTKLQATEKNAEGMTGADSAVTATPYWKRYTMIDRKRLTTVSDAVTSTEQDDLIKAGTAQSSVSIAKALSITSGIPSLDELKNEILALNNKTTESLDMELSTEEISTTSSMELTDTSTVYLSTTEATTETTRLDIVSSKRAGFLDFSLRPTVGTEMTTAQKVDKPIEILKKDTSNSLMQTTLKSQEVQRSSTASQSQLAEDAINEELMKEEILKDNVTAQRQREDILVIKAKETKNVEQPPIPDSSVEDKLSVKPISAEKIRPQGGLYTVSPNYKPLKKIEVQPPKPFVRNPDDNSWRNESLSSLGIVFKANNSTKPFTQVLKNKTETEWNALLEKYSKGDEPELRERLEKIAEQRKSKKKKINQFGETVYTDYEESTSGENLSSLKPNDMSEIFARVTAKYDILKATTIPPSEVKSSKPLTTSFDIFKTEAEEVETTTSAGNSKKVLDDYESEDDEPDYTLANIDLKKFMTPPRTTETPAPAPPVFTFTGAPTVRNFLPDRKPTIQYFPPREKQKVVVNDYDTDFQRKVNSYTYKDPPNKITNTMPRTQPTQPTFQFPKHKFEPPQKPNEIRPNQNLNKNIYMTHSLPVDQGSAYVVNQDGSYNRATYVIKHLRDFIDEVAKADDNANIAATEVPVRGVTTNEGIKVNIVKAPNDYYDYETQFKKDVIDRFVENFNQNSERFKADFPILYNTTVVHNKFSETGKQASSSAFMKRLYENAQAIQNSGNAPTRFDPHCDHTVELSPAYELHYYVPEEEEKEEYVPKAASILPYRFGL